MSCAIISAAMTSLANLFGNYFAANRISHFVRSRPGHATSIGLTQTPAWFRTVIASHRSSAALREHLAQLPGEERLEFLLVYTGFTQVANSLQRFEHLRAIIHRFFQEGSERYLALSAETRHSVLGEWAPWRGQGRIPPGCAFPHLAEVAGMIRVELATQGR